MRTKFFFLSLLCSLIATAQLPTDFRSEQIYLNLQQKECLPGDTLLLEGQVTSIASDRFLPYSNYLYIECFNEKDSVLVRQKVSCKENGYFSTHLLTEYEWPVGVYYLRAYTRLMQNFSYESFAQHPFLIGKEYPKKEEQVYEARCTIVPSGGKLVADFPQTLAVLLTDDCTFPVSASLQLMSEKGDTLELVKTSASGMAQLKFIPLLGVNYYLTGNIDGRDYHFPLPNVTNNTKVQGSLNGKRLSYQILNGHGKGNILYTYDRLNGLTRTDVERDNGILMLDKVPEAVTLFLTNTDNHILSEYTLAGKQERRKRMQVPDTIKLNETIRYELPSLPEGSRVMTRIVADNDLLTTSGEKALKYLSDYTSPLPFPRHLYAANEAEFNNDLHTWLSTARFQRFNLAEALAKDTALYVHAPEQVMMFGGKIEKKSGHPMKNGQLVAYHTTKDFVYDASLIGNTARFLLPVDDFMEGEEFFLQAITAKGKPDFAEYLVDEETYPALENNRRFRLPLSRYADSEVIVGNDFNLNYSVDKNNERNYTLPNVTVKARLRTEKVKDTHEFYSTTYVGREEIDKRPHRDLFNILEDMQGVIVGKSWVAGEGYIFTLKSTRGNSTLPSEGGPANNVALPILLDGIRTTDYNMIFTMPSSEIESVRVLRAWEALAYTFGAINGAVLITTRYAREKEPLPSKGAMYSPTGLSPLSYPYKGMASPSLKCSKPGNYRLIVDVITGSDIRSYEHAFQVVE